MDIVYTVYFFILGAVLGSFYNVVGLRIPKKQSIVHPGSHCTSCQKKLTGIELIPIFSYVFQKGKCRGCGAKFSPIYMFTELLTAILFAASYLYVGFTAELFVALLFISLLVCITVSDLSYMLIPDKILMFFLPLLIIGRLFSPLTPWWDSIVAAILGFSLLLLIAIVSKGGMGGGDIKLFFLLGIVLGTVNTLLTLFFAAIIGMMIGLIVLKVKKQGRKTPIPFGPSIALAAIVVYFHGDTIAEIYVNFL